MTTLISHTFTAPMSKVSHDNVSYIPGSSIDFSVKVFFLFFPSFFNPSSVKVAFTWTIVDYGLPNNCDSTEKSRMSLNQAIKSGEGLPNPTLQRDEKDWLGNTCRGMSINVRDIRGLAHSYWHQMLPL